MKAHVLYDIEVQIPAFYTVTTALKYDSIAMSLIHYDYYIFDRLMIPLKNSIVYSFRTLSLLSESRQT